MSYMRFLIFFCALLPMVSCENPSADSDQYHYPQTRQDSTVVDNYHGVEIADPYRWLEDDRSAETAAWVDAQNAFTSAHLSSLPARPDIRDRLSRLYNYERFGVPSVVGEYLYFSKNDGLQDQALIYREPLRGGESTLVLDPNTFSEDNTSSLSSYSFSDDGDYMAYQVSTGGSDWKSVRVLNLKTLTHTSDSLEWIKFSGIIWSGDGFFYSRYDEPVDRSALSSKNENHQLFYHKLGSPQADDRLIFVDREHPQRNVYASIAPGSDFLVIGQTASTSGNSVKVCRLENTPSGKTLQGCTDVVTTFSDDYNLIGAVGRTHYFWTNAGASNGSIVSFDVNDAAASFKTVVANSPDGVLKSVTLSGKRLYLRYLSEVQSKLEVRTLDGQLHSSVELPDIGTTSAVSAASTGGDAFFNFSNFTTPGTIYRIAEADLSTTIWRKSDNGFDATKYITKQIRYRSKDGTEVPMFIVHAKDLKLDGERPTLLYGYGGFDIAIEPRHAVMRLDLVSPILEQGGVCAVANIRGGGEFGSTWHEQGTKANKQNVFDDFIAAAEYLQQEGYTSPQRTAIYGRSNGGLLVGACITQRPDLYGVAFPAVGVLDMLRYHEFTIGWAWAGDYGRADSASAFPYLRAYSPLHNATPQAYPATMITTADHDDRVVPAHSFKFAAAMQQAQQADAPILIRIDKSSGHGAGKPVSKQIEESTDLLAFMFHHMKYPYTLPQVQ